MSKTRILKKRWALASLAGGSAIAGMVAWVGFKSEPPTTPSRPGAESAPRVTMGQPAAAPKPIAGSMQPDQSGPTASTATVVTTQVAPQRTRKLKGELTEQERKWTAEARPTEKTSLRLLDLTKVPSQKDLMMAGQLGEELHPTFAAEPSAIADPAARKKLEEANLSFGHAIQKWNLHDYEEAQVLFLDHLTKHKDSPWAAESELHLGCACQYLGKYEEAQKWFEAAQSHTPLGHPMHQKALLRLGVVAMDRGEFAKATELFTSLRENDSEPARKTYASYWIKALSLMNAQQTVLRDCGQKSLGEICQSMGREESARKLREMAAAGPHGFTIQELEQLAKRHGLPAHTVRGSGSNLTKIPLPFIAHYKDQHFVAVLGRDEKGSLKIYDTRVGHTVPMPQESFVKQWSGLATVFSKVKAKEIRVASVEETREAIGGCCGLPRNPDDLDDDCPSSCGMPSWSVNPINMNLVVRDTPIWWDAPYGPDLDLEITYNSLDSLIAIRPFGDKWTFAYASYLVVDPSGSVKVIRGGGRGENFSPNGSGGYNSNARNASKTLRKLAGSAYRFELEEADGTKYLYDVPPAMGGSSASSLLLSITDKYGTAVTITHNSQGAVTAVSHPAGGTWSFTYNANGKVSQITDPFLRAATFTYNAQNQLTGQTDMGGIAYGYTYTTAAKVRERDPANPTQFVVRTNELFLNSIITPSGTTSFYTEPADGINNSLNAYPLPGGVMWEDYRITVTDALNQKEEYYFDGYAEKSWHRDRNHYLAGDPETVKTVWDVSLVNGLGEISRIDHQGGGATVHSSFTNGGSAGTTTTPDGHTHTYTYNTQGYVLTHKDNNATSSTADDILLTYVYAANGLDVTQITRKIGTGTAVTLATLEHHATTRDITAVVDQLGLRNEYERNSLGQLISAKNAKGDVLSYHYGLSGRLETLKILPIGQPTAIPFSSAVYDDIGRIASETDARGYALIHEYDDLNRRTKTTFPDLSFTLKEFSCCVLISTTERDGIKTRYGYDSIKRLIGKTSPNQKVEDYGYDKAGNLTSLRSGRGELVKWEYDVANRLTARINQDGTRLAYAYNANTSRLTSETDTQNRQTIYSYNSNGWLQNITHPALPTQSFTYNSLGQRLTWTDGTQVTTYGYDGFDRLTSVDGPLTNDTITYGFDAWGRMNSWTYDGASETYTFDALERIATVTNPLGTFTHGYDGNSNTPTQLLYPVPGLTSTFSYEPLNQDAGLSEILYKGPGDVEIAKFNYAYHPGGDIANWEQKQPGLTGRNWQIKQDLDEQLDTIVELPLAGPPPNPQRTWRHRYDPSGNRTLHQQPGNTTTATYNSRNQMTTVSSGGATWFRGQVDEAAQVTVGGQPATMRNDGSFDAVLTLGSGIHDVTVTATDQAANTTTEIWRVDNGSSTPRTFTYDSEGNTLSDGLRTYSWDAANRLQSITDPSNNWTFTYDGKNRRRSESKNGALVRNWIWDGLKMLEERLPTGSKRRYWSHGFEEINSSGVQVLKRFILSDHLGSARVITDDSGAVQSSFDYTPWGQRSVIASSSSANIGYAGHWEHECGLTLAPMRAYDSSLGRWLSEDPIAEDGGINLYGYTTNNPIGAVDLFGFSELCLFSKLDRAYEWGRDDKKNRTTGQGGAFVVTAHATFAAPGAIFDDRATTGAYGGIRLSAGELLKLMVAKGYRVGSGRPIILASCESTPIARELARLAQAPTSGNTECLWSGDDTIGAGKTGPDGVFRKINKPGHQVWFDKNGDEILPPGFNGYRKDIESNYSNKISFSPPPWLPK